MDDTSPSPALGRAAADRALTRAVRAFVMRLHGKYPVRETIVFGSRARGDHTAESDADLVLVLEGRGGDRSRIAGDMAALAFDVMLETGVLIDPLPLWEDELRHPEQFGNPALIRHIQRDGCRF